MNLWIAIMIIVHVLSTASYMPDLVIVVDVSAGTDLISSREKLAVCDVTNLPYMVINRQPISIYCDFVTSLTAYYSCGYISTIIWNLHFSNVNEIVVFKNFEFIVISYNTAFKSIILKIYYWFQCPIKTERNRIQL